MLSGMPICSADDISYFIEKARECESAKPYDARSWLLTASAFAPTNFQITLEAYLLEKRLENVGAAATRFVNLFKKFLNCLDDEIAELANAVRNHHMNKGKETPEELFLLQIFDALPKDIQMEVLMQRSEHTTVIYEKCQFMLLLVKLYPDTVIAHGVGEDLLYNVLGCDSDVFSTFRSLLVNELVPAVLQLTKNLAPSVRLITLLNQCIEYYTLVPDPVLAGRSEDFLELTTKRWDKLYAVVDQIGITLSWKICPFFSSSVQSSSSSVESMYHSLSLVFQHQSHCSTVELAYISVVLFLRCVVTANQLGSYVSSNFCASSNLTLVEIFYPQSSYTSSPPPPSPIITTVSQYHTVSSVQSSINSYFISAVKLWQLINNGGGARGDRIEKEVKAILNSMKSLNLDTWQVFLKFLVDFRLYTGKCGAEDVPNIEHPLKLASVLCSMKQHQKAAEAVLKAIAKVSAAEGESSEGDTIEPSSSFFATDLSFFHHQMHGKENMKLPLLKRFHFISDGRSEIIYYAANVLIRCLHESMVSGRDTNEFCVGHLLTLVQLEWPSPAAEFVVHNIMQCIRKRGSFCYFPYFGDYIILPDFLEMFLYVANRESKTVALELFTPATSRSGNGSRRMATRGADKGVKNDFKQAIKRQMARSTDATAKIESVVWKFLCLNVPELMQCFGG